MLSFILSLMMLKIGLSSIFSKQMRAGAVVCCTLLLTSCQSSTKQGPIDALKRVPYVNLRTYFIKEADKLQTNKTSVLKTIEVNGSSQTLERRVIDWKKELAFFFSSSDITKAAWQGKYKITSNQKMTTYQSTDPDLKIREIAIRYGTGPHTEANIKGIHIELLVQNFLYRFKESLQYYPDSMYFIQRQEDILLLGKKRYFIKGMMICNPSSSPKF